MSPLRRSILANLFLWILISGLLSYGIAFGLSFLTNDLIILLSAGLGAMTLFTLLVVYSKLARPMKLVILEMKALLTGKSYRRVMTKRRDEIGVLAHFFNEVTRNLENISSDVHEHEILKKEVDLAQSIQRDLLPKEIPKIPGLDLAAKTRPASEIGGDAYNFYQENDRHIMYIGDSTGHGVPAGLIMIMVDVLMDTFVELEDDLVEMLVQINRFLKPNLRTTMFMTIILLEWIPTRKTLQWVGAGHEHVIHIKPSTDHVNRIPAGGIALGMLADNRALSKIQEIQLEAGDFVILFSDGITEAKNVTGEIYTVERLEEFAKIHTKGDTTANDLFEKIAVDVSRFMEGHRQDDDMTLMIFKCLSDEESVEVSEVPQEKAPAL